VGRAGREEDVPDWDAVVVVSIEATPGDRELAQPVNIRPSTAARPTNRTGRRRRGARSPVEKTVFMLGS
jgi:hypothetical protein